jgi:hypothetical protein
LARFAAFEDEADQKKVGFELAVSQNRRVRDDGWAGLYLMTPAAPHMVGDVLRDLRSVASAGD